MNKRSSLFLFLAFIIAAISLFTFMLQPVWQHDKYSVTVAVSKTPLSTPFYVAQSINAFADTCVDVEMVPVIGGQMAFSQVIQGQADFGTTSDSVIAFQSLTKQAFVNHAMFVQSDNDVKLITNLSDKIESGIDLKGKRVGVTKGTASEYFLSTLLAIDGLTVRDVELFHYKPDQLSASLINNEVDAIVPWEPFAFQNSQLMGKKIKIHNTKNLNTLSFNLISKAADSLLVEKAKCIIQGLNIAIDFIASHPKESQQIVIEKLNIDPAFIRWVWPDYIFKLGLNQSLLLAIKSRAIWLVDTQMTSHKELPNFNQFIDSRAMLQVAPRSVNISP